MKRTSHSVSAIPSSRSMWPLAIAAAFSLSAPLAAHAMDFEWRLKATAAGVADSGRDLGLNDASDTREAYVDVTPWMHVQFSPDWAGFVRVRGYAPTGRLLQPGDDDNNESATKKAFVGLKEAWIEYGGLTSYPGETLRIGRQRIRNDDTQFFDEDIDAARWIFDTTLLQADLGVAHQFDTYRTDNIDLPQEQDHRTYAFGSLAYDWRAHQRVGMRVVYAGDDNHLPDAGEPVDTSKRLTKSKQAWINVYFDDHPYDWRDQQAVSYWLQGTYLTGSRDSVSYDPVTGLVTTSNDGANVDAWEGEGGLRAKLNQNVQAGVAVAHSGGGGKAQYEQTGTQSNYSRFTGTRSQIYRFNDAFRPELGNLQAATAFVSASGGQWDGSVVYNKLRRPDDRAPVVSDALSVTPSVRDHDLGQGVDVVVTRYFDLSGAGGATAYTPDDTGDSSVRLRASWFDPGKAYGSDAKNEYRILMEFTLWY
ncbi:alginate export family protein [Solimonas marina]|uniref:Alginate export family protein n=1 Tax=Solimonas marina TaxID=2714601 RepID=A0A969W9K8_9GAMM|nr:alginate export family protein [Solimonas marina]NKF22424.1 alginate export family protein [Solimonas marina]